MLLALLASVALSQTPAPRETSTYALVVTNNRSLTSGRPDLRYADDDGAKYAALFSDYFGPDRVTLLTRFDEETQKLSPQWAKSSAAPTLANVNQAIDKLARIISEERAAQKDVELYLVFAGHGDIDRGQGYLELQDSRLTSRDLEERVIRRLSSARIHLLLDSCNSFYMLNPRKPGGKRWQTTQTPADGLLSRYPNVGAILSTSSEAVTYEWSELQSGIFSYEVRSGLRGAADADGDGLITYDELTAFIHVANEPVPNELYRPKVFSSAPGRNGSIPVLRSPPQHARLLRVPSTSRRFTIRDGLGVRVVDVNKETGSSLALVLPASSQLGLYEELADKTSERPVIRYRDIPSTFHGAMDQLVATQPQLASRGEAPVFAALFTKPFGPTALASYRSPKRLEGQAAGELGPAVPKAVPQTQAPVAGDSGAALIFWTSAAGLDDGTRDTLNDLVAAQLRKRGLQVRSDARLLEPHSLDVESQRLASELNASRMFALHVGRLGKKTVITLQEVSPASLSTLDEASISVDIEEADRIVPRLVKAVLEHVDLEETAQMRNVSNEEARPYQKKAGERMWAFGLPFGLTGGGTRGAFGFSVAWMYETTHFRLGLTGELVVGASMGAGLVAIEGGWLPLDGAWSPYLVGGAGYMTTTKDVSTGNGAGFTLEVGVEFFRLHGTKLMVGAQALLPAYTTTQYETGRDQWTPIFLLHTRIAF
jgi:hypothetical protein